MAEYPGSEHERRVPAADLADGVARIFEAKDRADVNHKVNRTTLELLCGMVETAQQAGIEHIVSVFDARMARIFRSIDCRFEQLGTPARIGKTLTYAGLFDMNQDMRSRLGAAGNFREPVLADVALPLRFATGRLASAG